MKYEKCQFCEHDRPPMLGECELCKMCFDASNFQRKTRLSIRAVYEYEKLLREEEYINNLGITGLDRNTALIVLKALTKYMYPSQDCFGNKTLVIKRDKFEIIRKRFLD